MKTIFITLLLLLACSIIFGLEYQISGGFDMANVIYADSFLDSGALIVGTKYQPGFSISAEVMKNISAVVLGLGAEYQFKRKHQKMGEGWSVTLKDISFLPVYTKLGFSFPVTHGPVPEIFAHVGYGFALMDDTEEPDIFGSSKWSFDGGMYYAFGFGIEYNQILLQTLIRYNDMKAHQTEISSNGDIEKDSYDHFHRQISFKIGHRF